MKIYLTSATDGTEGSGQGATQQTDPGLDTAMGSWGEGERDGQQAEPVQGQPATTQAAPAQRTQTSAPAAGSQQQTAAVAAQAPAQDTASLIRAAVESTAAAMQKSQGQTAGMERAQKTMSEEEFAQRYGITKYDAKAIERLFDKDPAKAAEVLNEINRNSYTSAVRMANDLLAAQAAALEGKYASRFQAVEKFMATQVEREATDRFYSQFPALKPESDLVKEVLDATQAKIARGELRFTDEKQAFQYVADATQKVVSRMTPSTGTQGNGQQSPAGTRQMAQATQSARPGGQPNRVKSDMDAVMSAWDEKPED